jgi:tetratricopeptide (TPR) repeat protein
MLQKVLIAVLAILLVLPGIGAVPAPAWAIERSEAELQQVYNDLSTLFGQAFAATDAGKMAEAETIWTQAIERSPDNPAAWSNRGNSRVSQFKLEAAIADFDQAIALAPDQPNPYINRGTAWEGLREWDRAIADYNRALELQPDDPVAINNRGNAQGAKGNWEQAKADFYDAAIAQPGFALANINYALSLYQLGDTVDGLRKLRNLARRYSNSADVRAAYTAALWDQGRQGEAESNWVAAIGLDPRYKDIDWVANIRRWPPVMVDALGRFLSLK